MSSPWLRRNRALARPPKWNAPRAPSAPIAFSTTPPTVSPTLTCGSAAAHGEASIAPIKPVRAARRVLRRRARFGCASVAHAGIHEAHHRVIRVDPTRGEALAIGAVDREVLPNR